MCSSRSISLKSPEPSLFTGEVRHFAPASCVIGAGIGFTYGAMPTLIMGVVPASETGAANALDTLMRSIGTSAASAVAGVVPARTTTGFGTFALPSENAFRTVLALGAGAALLGFVIAAFLPRRRAGSAAGEAAADRVPDAVGASEA